MMADDKSLTGRERTSADDEIIVSKTDLKGRITYANSYMRAGIQSNSERNTKAIQAGTLHPLHIPPEDSVNYISGEKFYRDYFGREMTSISFYAWAQGTERMGRKLSKAEEIEWLTAFSEAVEKKKPPKWAMVRFKEAAHLFLKEYRTNPYMIYEEGVTGPH